jgi:polar amino acid transport system permease protein
MGYDWDFSVVGRFFPVLGPAFLVTVGVTIITYGVTLVLGAIVVLARIGRRGWLRRVAIAYVAVFRGLPLVVMIIWAHFALPIITGWQSPVLVTGVGAISLHMSSFVAEDFRAGILSVPRGHVEGARALGLSYFVTLRRVVFPQAIQVVLGPLLNEFIETLKGTTLLMVLAFPELMYVGNRIAVTTFRPIEILTVVALMYLSITLPLAITVRRIQRVHRARSMA